MKLIHIASINRSGGSLLARLFDNHPDVISYPVQFSYPPNKDIYSFHGSKLGEPCSIPEYKGGDPLAFFNVPKKRPETVVAWGKESHDFIGVRKNYLQKEYFQDIKTDFDYDLFVKTLSENGSKATSLQELYDARHYAYFKAWDEGKHMQNPEYVITQGAGQLFITNFDYYFSSFSESFIIHPIRDVMGFIASEKSRLTRRFYGSKRFTAFKFPNSLVKNFNQYNLEAHIRAWKISLTRAVLLQEKYGVDSRFIMMTYENLVQKPEEVMKALCDRLNMTYQSSLLEPTIGGVPWSGSSHQGRQKGINANLANYYRNVLTDKEINLIEKECRSIREYLKDCAALADLTKISKDLLYDYDKQKEYMKDEEKIALYLAFALRDLRQYPIGSQSAWSLLAWLYSQWIKIVHMPRIWRNRIFKGWGRQNYT